MHRRLFIQGCAAAAIGAPVLAAVTGKDFEAAVAELQRFIDSGQVRGAAITVSQRGETMTRTLGSAGSPDAMFLLGSISKPVCVSALMTLFDRGQFKLADPLQKFIPAFAGDGREHVTLQHLLTHVSGLPDQLPNNDQLRRSHAPLAQFVEQAIRTPLSFAPGTKYQYSSMGILLATHVAELLTSQDIRSFVDAAVFQPLGLKHSAQGLGRFAKQAFVPVQTEFGAPESGAGDPAAKDWDWNSDYWRALGAPWGGTHASVGDIRQFIEEFLFARGTFLRPETERLMTSNHNPPGVTPRGLGFNVGAASASPGCSDRSFGHTGSTGTLAWGDPKSETVCVVFTSLPGRAVSPHPRELAAARVAEHAA